MKILLITNGSVDYLTCMIMHGLYNLLGEDFTHTTDYKVMYKMPPEEQNKLYGRGFTIYGNLEEYLNNNIDLENKINNKYFDKILIDRFSIYSKLTDLSLSIYDSGDVAYLDGEDHSNYENKFLNRIKYFKREKIDDNINSYPISFSIPLEKFNNNVLKVKKLAESNPNPTPGDFSSFKFDDESEYYTEYGRSYFGTTRKKGGWDSLRHYEILANNCIPLFSNLKNCPTNTLFNFPKKDIIDSEKLYHNFNEVEYYDKVNLLYNYSKENLTTIAVAKYLIDKMKK